MKVYAMTDIGKNRAVNEDSYYLPTGDEQFCAVADGMGGHNAGEVASARAVETFATNMRMAGVLDAFTIRRAIRRANEAVYNEACGDASKQGMGTTFTGLCLGRGMVYVAHVGDSRAYRIRDRKIEQITTDHSLVEEMVDAGLITREEARVHPRRNYITRALGTGWSVEIDVYPQVLRKGDVYLLCSDGLSGMLDEPELLEVTLSEGTWEERTGRLVQLALDAGGPDNITAMYVTFEEADS